MRYGLSIINLGPIGHPAIVQDLARRAEAAGWDGVLVWDHLGALWDPNGLPVSDPWTLLAGAACVTERVLLGTNVTPVPRRRPQVLATQVATLDHLSGGRAVLGVGLGGVEDELVAFGEVVDARERGAMLDEALEVITALWSGERVFHRGPHYVADGVQNRLVPVGGRARCPVWVGGTSAAARRRAARWDGWTTDLLADETGRIGVTPEELAASVADVLAHRTARQPFEVVVSAYSSPDDAGVELAAAYEAAGATWWLEGIDGLRAQREDVFARTDAGPPRGVGEFGHRGR